MSAPSPPREPLSSRLARRLDRLCDRFEAARRAGRRPRLEHYLERIPAAARANLLRELLALELEYRRQAGESPVVEEYRERFPEHEKLVSVVFDEFRPARTSPDDLLSAGTLDRLVSEVESNAFTPGTNPVP